MPTVATSRQRAKDERLQAHLIADGEYRVYNVARKTSYSVLRAANGTWHCTCPFAIHGTISGNCKHLQAVLDKIEREYHKIGNAVHK